MNDKNRLIDMLELEREVESIAPVVRQGLSGIAGPSERTIQAIHLEAVSRAFSQNGRWMPLFRIMAAAASLVLLIGGALQYRVTRQAGAHAQTLQLVLQIGAPHAINGPVDGTTELANRLLNIQGLDEETLFTPDETEVLSL